MFGFDDKAQDSAINVLALVIKGERFVWLYTDSERPEVMRSIGRFASNPDLPNFTWYWAGVLMQKIRHEAHQKADQAEEIERLRSEKRD